MNTRPPIVKIKIVAYKTKKKALQKILNFVFSLMLAAGPLILPLVPQTADAAPFTFSAAKSIDVMKYTKDVIADQPSDAAITNLVNTLATAGITDIALSVPMDSTADFQAYGTNPSPRSVEAFTQKWADAVHQKGLHVIWRGTWSGMEGIYNFPQRVGTNRLPAGTAASAPTDGQNTWTGKNYQYIINHPSFFQDGDLWAPMPERTEGIFSDSTSFISADGAGLQTNYANFFNDIQTSSASAFAGIGKSVLTGMSTNNYSEFISTWLPQSLANAAGAVTIDYYGINHTAAEIDSDFRKMSSTYGKPIFLQEWGDYWDASMSQTDRTIYLQSIYAELQKLVNDGILIGFNYWGGWDNSGEGIVTQSGDNFTLNYRGQLLASFFKANSITAATADITPAPALSPSPSPTPTPIPTTSPTTSTTLTCLAPATNAFTGCYYTDQNFGNLGLERTDANINFDWGQSSPDPAIPADLFSARWQGSYNLNGGTYNFSLTGDDGVRLYIDNQLVIDKWHDQGSTTYTASVNLTAGTHLIRMDYYEAYGGAVAELNWNLASTASTTTTIIDTSPPPSTTYTAPAPNCPAPADNAFTGCFYSGQNFEQFDLARIDQNIKFNWGHSSPAPQVPSDNFSVIWQGNFDFTSGAHTFNVTADDGVRLYIDNQLVIDRWHDQPSSNYSYTINFPQGKHLIRMDYYEAYGGAVAKLNWN